MDRGGVIKHQSLRWIIRAIVQSESGDLVADKQITLIVDKLLSFAEENQLQLIISSDKISEEPDAADQLPPFFIS